MIEHEGIIYCDSLPFVGRRKFPRHNFSRNAALNFSIPQSRRRFVNPRFNNSAVIINFEINDDFPFSVGSLLEAVVITAPYLTKMIFNR